MAKVRRATGQRALRRAKGRRRPVTGSPLPGRSQCRGILLVPVSSLALRGDCSPVCLQPTRPREPGAAAGGAGGSSSSCEERVRRYFFFFSFFRQFPLIWPSFRYCVFILRLGGGAFHWRRRREEKNHRRGSAPWGLRALLLAFPVSNLGFSGSPAAMCSASSVFCFLCGLCVTVV